MVKLFDSTLGASAPSTLEEVEILRCWQGMAEPYRQMTLALVKRLAEEHPRPKAKVQRLRLISVGVVSGKGENGEEK